MVTTAWNREHVAALGHDHATCTPVIATESLTRLVPGLDFWDLWPVRTPDGAVADVHGYEVWAGLSAAAVGDPGGRHDVARIRLVGRAVGGGWEDLGPLFPDGASAGSREWAGATLLDAGSGVVTAYYTAAGTRGETSRTFRQRIFTATGRLDVVDRVPRVGGWSEHTEVLVADGRRYVLVDAADGVPGFIKAFRDPFPFRDPADGADHLLFTASMACAGTDFNGCVGLARHDGDAWHLLDPLMTADGVNNELERPQVLVHDGQYLLFFSTQSRTFHPDCPGPTGLYGFTADRLLGPYAPLNGSGLVLCNPAEEPFQAYSWMVLPGGATGELVAYGFVDAHQLEGRDPETLVGDAEAGRRHFGGTMTAPSRIRVTGDRTALRPG